MICETVTDFASRTCAGTRLLGLDLGTRTVGMALSDATRTVATPVRTLQRTKLRHDLAVLAETCAAQDVAGIVLGLPINMNGSEGPRCQATRQFAADLTKHVALPILLWDERLSTAAVTRGMLEADLSRRKRAKVVDQLAAAYILQGALDALCAVGIK